MPAHRKRTRTPSWLKATEFALAVPQVVSHRLTRMASAGMSPSARDRSEFLRMGTEKVAAFAESWNAMAMEAMRVQQRASILWWRAFWMPWLYGNPNRYAASSMRNAQRRIFGKGMAPIQRRAVANAKRLARTGARP